MKKQVSMATRKELIQAVGERYRAASTTDKTRILDEFVELAGYHRKHAIRVLSQKPPAATSKAPRQRVYDDAFREKLIVVWEASDRLCGKRLKALIPSLIEAMERHRHLSLDQSMKQQLLRVSAATIDRLLSEVRAGSNGERRRRSGIGTAIRRSVPVRTFSDWRDPPPGYLEVDMVEHCGPKTEGDYVRTLVLTDINSGWTECLAMPVRNQTLIVEALNVMEATLPFKLLGIDTDNDTAFMNQTVFDHCKERGLEQTRSRPYRKNDQAWVEQKNGAIVRRLVGYGRLSGLAATYALAELYSASRLYINFFQPSFKLKAKTRDGARVSKKYHPPATPCDRLLDSPAVPEDVKARLRKQFTELDPVRLLRDMRTAQQVLHEMLSRGPQDEPAAAAASSPADVSAFLAGLSTAWKSGEVNPIRGRRGPSTPRWWRSRVDPFEHSWPVIEGWLIEKPSSTARELMDRLAAAVPEAYANKKQLRTLQRRIKAWRAQQLKELILGKLKKDAPECALP
ncbi:transposase family protein [uncultured Azohydromonas sp.]|uniref:integrase catalytic domain-containing protein n=1 Tax=uncultured Azohydromonas sp. TaxID=487342 RepID=UPI00261263B1|nr:transposase family protein [uncultured Azohydromonas sp.]